MSERKRAIWVTKPGTNQKQIVIDVDAIEYAAERSSGGVEIHFKSGTVLNMSGANSDVLDRIVVEWLDGKGS